MTDQEAAPEAASTAAAPSEQDQEAVVGLVTDGAHALIIGRFPTMEETQQAYQALQEPGAHDFAADRWRGHCQQ